MLKKWIAKIKQDKKLLLIVALAGVGVLLLVMSEWLSAGGEEKTAKAETVGSDPYLLEYRTALEESLKKTVSSIDGAGICTVMVTLDCTVENIYAQNQNTENGAHEEESSYTGTSDYVIVKSGSSTEQGLLLTVLQPKVRGVAVVCEGGDSFIVKQAITEAVTALFSVGSNQVSVAKMKADREDLS